MAFEILSTYHFMSKAGDSKSFNKPHDILSEHHLSPYQKSVILEAMLSEARDGPDVSFKWEQFFYSSDQKIADILKAQASLKS